MVQWACVASKKAYCVESLYLKETVWSWENPKDRSPIHWAGLPVPTPISFRLGCAMFFVCGFPIEEPSLIPSFLGGRFFLPSMSNGWWRVCVAFGGWPPIVDSKEMSVNKSSTSLNTEHGTYLALESHSLSWRPSPIWESLYLFTFLKTEDDTRHLRRKRLL